MSRKCPEPPLYILMLGDFERSRGVAGEGAQGSLREEGSLGEAPGGNRESLGVFLSLRERVQAGAVAMIPAEIMASKELSPREKIVWGILARFQGNHSASWPSYKTLAKASGLDCDAVRKTIRRLCAKRFLSHSYDPKTKRHIFELKVPLHISMEYAERIGDPELVRRLKDVCTRQAQGIAKSWTGVNMTRTKGSKAPGEWGHRDPGGWVKDVQVAETLAQTQPALPCPEEIIKENKEENIEDNERTPCEVLSKEKAKSKTNFQLGKSLAKASESKTLLRTNQDNQKLVIQGSCLPVSLSERTTDVTKTVDFSVSAPDGSRSSAQSLHSEAKEEDLEQLCALSLGYDLQALLNGDPLWMQPHPQAMDKAFSKLQSLGLDELAIMKIAGRSLAKSLEKGYVSEELQTQVAYELEKLRNDYKLKKKASASSLK